MADGFFPTLVSKDANANSASNVIFVNLSDGTDTLAVNADGSLNVTVTGGAANTQFAEDTAHASGDIGTEMLAVRRDTPVSGVSADGDYATLNVDANGRLYVQTGTVTVTATDLDIRDLNSGTDSVTVLATNLDIRDLAFATDKVDASGSTLGANSGVDIGDVTINNAAGAAAVNIQDGGNSITVDGTVAVSGSVTVTATDLDIRDLNSATDSVAVTDGGGSLTVDGTVTVTATDLDIRNLNLTDDAVKISGNSSANSSTNPIFVQNVSGNITGEVHDYNTAASVGGGSTSNHNYTVTTAMRLSSIIVSASGACKVEVQTGPVASLVSRAVGFVPKEGGSLQLNFDPPIEVPTTSTGTVRLIRTNREGSSQDLYSTIIGIDA
jgi:hypothetical protein